MLVLTKPLGTGIIATAIKRGVAPPDVVAAATESMTTLNRDGAEAALTHGATTMTDITGFGLLGHLGSLCAASGVSAEIWADELPWLPGVAELAREGTIPGGTRRNLAHAQPWTEWVDSFADWETHLIADAQTSGGLLIAVPEERVPALVADLQARGTPAAAVIGRLLPLGTQRLVVRRRR